MFHILIKVAPYSFTIARALMAKAQIICVRWKENFGVFWIFHYVSMRTKGNTLNFLAFPSVKFFKIWQIGSKYFTLVRARFSGKSIIPVVKDIDMTKI